MSKRNGSGLEGLDLANKKGFKYGKLERADVLTMLRMGLILVDTNRGKSYRLQRDESLSEMAQFTDHAGRAAVRVYWGKKRCGIMVNVLTWMAHHLRLPGEGMDIDHIDGNNRNDCIDNLAEVPMSINRSLGQQEIEKEFV